MRVLLRFFTDDETMIAQMDISKCPGIIPRRKDEVSLEDIAVWDNYPDFDYFIVDNVAYCYGEDLVLIDVMVKGRYCEC